VDRQAHWEKIHREKAADAVSWYRPHLDMSLRWIEDYVPDRSAWILDVGAGQSTLVDDLLPRGYQHITALDIASAALDGIRYRLGAGADRVRWLVSDVTKADLEPAGYDVWHDRAVFHFLTSPDDRGAYLGQLTRALKAGGHVVISTFALDGPEKCSGLDVARYDTAALKKELGDRFRLLQTAEEDHPTPSGATQRFLYCCFRMQ
jgi:SAM-dependent methyltransferase